MKKINKPTIIIFVFALIYLSQVILNHYYFKTYAFDYGLYNNAFFDYGHFRINDNPLTTPPLKNFLQDHLALPLIIFSPLYFLLTWLTGTYTLLIIEVAFILIGGWYTYRFIKDLTGDETISLLALFHFFILSGHFSALSGDYHDTVVGASLMPVFLYYMQKRSYWKSVIPFLFMLFTKENFSLWLIFVSTALILMNLKDKKHILVNSAYLVVSLVYLILAFKVFIPYFEQPEKLFWNFHYSKLGNSMGEVASYLVHHPIDGVKLFFNNPTGDPTFDYIKVEFYVVCLLSGAFVLFYRPILLIMFIPIVAQKMLNDRYVCWGIESYYMIEVVSILTLAVFIALEKIKQKKVQHWIAWIIVILTTLTTLEVLYHRQLPWYRKDKECFYCVERYKPPFDVQSVHKVLKIIPDNAKVVAHTSLVPHLAFRDYIYMYPQIRDADYIALLIGQNTYPLKKEEYAEKVIKLRNDKNWTIIYDQYPLLILKKKTAPQ